MITKHIYKYYLIVVVLYATDFVKLISCNLQNDEQNQLYSWYILDTTNMLQNVKHNIIVSPKILHTLLKTPTLQELRFGGDSMKQVPGESMTFIVSKQNLQFPKYLEILRNNKIQEMKLDQPNNLIRTINDWGYQITNRKMPKIIESESEIQAVPIFIINIFEFNEILQIDFKYKVNGEFYITPKNKIKVPSVETTDYFQYLDSQILDAQILRLPYSNNTAMYILLPHTKQGADELLNRLGYEQLKRMQWMMEEMRVNVLLPIFMSYSKIDLKNNIAEQSNQRFNIGLFDVFNKVAVDKKNIFQVTGLNFNGKGKQIIDSNKKRPAKFKKFYVDRPFVIYIEEESSGDIVCVGKIVKPIL